MRVDCTECGVEVAVGSLLTHRQIQHEVGRGDQGGNPPPPGEAQTWSSRLCESRPGHCLQVPRSISLVGRGRLAGGGPQVLEGMAEVGESDAGIEQVGCGCLDLGTDILCGGSVGPVVRVRDVGDDAAHWEGVGKIPPQVSLQADREATSEREVRSVDINLTGGRDGTSGPSGVGDLRLPPPEQGHTVHCDQAHYIPVSGGAEDTGAKDIQAVVVTGWDGCGRDMGGGLGGGTNEGEGGDGRDKDGDGLFCGEDNVSNVTIGTRPNASLACAPGLEHHHPIMSTFGDPVGLLDIYIYISQYLYHVHQSRS